MNITTDQIQVIRQETDDPYKRPQAGGLKSIPRRLVQSIAIPLLILGAMIAAFFLMDAILPLRDFWFHEAMLTQFGFWFILPSMRLFPGWRIIPPLPAVHIYTTPDILQSWAELPLLLGAFVIIFLVYFAALQYLPERISWRFLYRSTLLLGILFLCIPIVTSPDVYSYIAYAHMGVFYNLNPLTTLPTAIRSDPVYTYILWVDQPSAYGPTWIIITSFIQWILARLGLGAVLPMLLALRLLGLAMHLASTALIWSITGKLQQLRGYDAPYPSRARLRATLAFAWNPLLLFEAIANAHNDTTLLVFVLLVIWVLAQSKLASRLSRSLSVTPALPATPAWIARLASRIPADLRTPIAVGSLFALATCLKINIILLFPALLVYLWVQAPKGRRLRHAGAVTISYFGLIVLSYAPFWQGGAVLNVFSVNPGTYRDINTVAEFAAHLYNSIAALLGFPLGLTIDSPAERFMHTASTGLFVLLYALMLWRMVRAGTKMRTLNGLIYWMAVAWLLYCAIGSPWFWPWYLVTFFGLYALLEASGDVGEQNQAGDEKEPLFPWSFRLFRSPWTVRLLSFTMLSIYCFITWGPAHTFVPGLPGFLWAYLEGVWAWLLPLAGTALLAWKFRRAQKAAHEAAS